MLYLESFTFPDDERETSYIMDVKRKCYASFYPFKILSRRRFERIDFEPVTILYGGNGTGKFAVPAVDEGREDLRPGQRSGGCEAMDGA